MKIRRLKIRLFLVQAISILPFLIFIFYLFDLWYDTRVTSVLTSSANDAQVIAEYLKQNLHHGGELADVLANDTNVIKSFITNPAQGRSTIENIIKNAAEISNIIVYDTQGHPLVASFEMTEEQKSVNPLQWPYFQDVLRTSQREITNPYFGTFSKRAVIIISQPILIDNKIVAVMNIAMDATSLKQKIDQITSNGKNYESRQIFLLDSNDKNLIGTNLEPGSMERAGYLMTSISKQGQIEYIENKQLEDGGKKMIGASVQIPTVNWKVISVQPMEQVFYPLFKIQKLFWLIIGISFLFSFAVISYFLRKVRIVM